MKKFGVLAVLILSAAALAPAQTSAPTTQRSADQIEADLNATGAKLGDALGGGKAWQSQEAMKKASPAVLGQIHKMLGLFAELREANPQYATMVDQQVTQLHAMELVFGDAQETADNAAAVAKVDVMAQAEKAAADYVHASDDATRQKAIADFDTALKRDPGNDSLIGLLGLMTGTQGPPSPAVAKQLLAMLQNDAKSASAQEAARELDSQIKLKEMENKPLTLEEVTVDGTPFSTAQWKGKVILVDFWATWCGPCMAELPRVKQLYNQYHAKGLEVLGVSCDNSADDLKKFLVANPDMPWPQLFDAKSPGWNALATKYGIIGIPTMFLIDKQGVLRTVDARENMDTMIPQLLAEK